MRAVLFAIISICALTANAQSNRVSETLPPAADPLPYSVSGDYSGGGYLCRIDNGPIWLMFSRTHISCTDPDSVHSEALVITWGCPSTNTVYAMIVPYFAFNLDTDPAVRIMDFDHVGGRAFITIAVGTFAEISPPAIPMSRILLDRVATRPGSGCGNFPRLSAAKE